MHVNYFRKWVHLVILLYVNYVFVVVLTSLKQYGSNYIDRSVYKPSKKQINTAFDVWVCTNKRNNTI